MLTNLFNPLTLETAILEKDSQMLLSRYQELFRKEALLDAEKHRIEAIESQVEIKRSSLETEKDTIQMKYSKAVALNKDACKYNMLQ